MHAVWSLPPDDSDYLARWKAIKIAFAKTLPKTEELSAVRAARGERGIWQWPARHPWRTIREGVMLRCKI
ncbi:hypothetical protein [Aromatoleum bremense]|uniref:Uncharacterized protein n=1 Tax=Aromatoleum bremense TaxID=76115 RepID=A0ABX1P1F5_9RHOO|nr:hypothetical protein [Aromatoleum bremense]NMG17626.1 hypothetical protein [Aromatoleum bremense]QTQ32000.1 Uncharacterized protein pbN1_20100 [Aromatoleum bremense]